MALYDPLYTWLRFKSANIIPVAFGQIEAILWIQASRYGKGKVSVVDQRDGQHSACAM